MLGDTAVAVHPDDERYTHLIGKHGDPAAGRPAHPDRRRTTIPTRRRARARSRSRRRTTSTISRSAQRHDLPLINMLDAEGELDLAEQRGLRGRPCQHRRSSTETLDAARPRPLRRAQDDRREAGSGGPPRQDRAAHPHGAARRPLRRGDRAVPHRPVVRRRQDAGRAGDRGGARRARPSSCRRTGRRPISSGWRTSSPGAISRQLWWGHQIPAWYGPDGKVFVAETRGRGGSPTRSPITSPRTC